MRSDPAHDASYSTKHTLWLSAEFRIIATDIHRSWGVVLQSSNTTQWFEIAQFTWPAHSELCQKKLALLKIHSHHIRKRILPSYKQ